jgi:hypothetical protein
VTDTGRFAVGQGIPVLELDFDRTVRNSGPYETPSIVLDHDADVEGSALPLTAKTTGWPDFFNLRRKSAVFRLKFERESMSR